MSKIVHIVINAVCRPNSRPGWMSRSGLVPVCRCATVSASRHREGEASNGPTISPDREAAHTKAPDARTPDLSEQTGRSRYGDSPVGRAEEEPRLVPGCIAGHPGVQVAILHVAIRDVEVLARHVVLPHRLEVAVRGASRVVLRWVSVHGDVDFLSGLDIRARQGAARATRDEEETRAQDGDEDGCGAGSPAGA